MDIKKSLLIVITVLSSICVFLLLTANLLLITHFENDNKCDNRYNCENNGEIQTLPYYGNDYDIQTLPYYGDDYNILPLNECYTVKTYTESYGESYSESYGEANQNLNCSSSVSNSSSYSVGNSRSTCYIEQTSIKSL